MRHTLSSSHIAFYRSEGYIEFTDLIAKEDALAVDIPDFKNAHDLFKKDCSLSTKKSLAKIASELSGEKKLRILYDQGFSSQNDFSQKIFQPTNLQTISSFQGFYLGLLLKLSDAPSPEIADTLLPAPSKIGSGIFFSQEKSIHLKALLNVPNSRYLLIVYGALNVRYIRNEADPFTHELKKYGYNYGDTLKDRLHPVL